MIGGTPTTGNADITLNNGSTGVLNAGGLIEADLNNAGLITVVGPSQFNLTQVTGNLTQSSSGRLSINIDFDTQQADMLAVGGAASLAGLVELHSTSILPQRSVEILSAGGTITQQGIAVAPSALFGYGLTQRTIGHSHLGEFRAI